ncbi:type II toxin-antitoxin system PemK/MazF family toxin [Clostridium perfringens]|uniref:type II toxin-antitoxin system PemK/MazF family toxin n=1 Tax=Clostridium perfringens TaxID=1502 RepID=UPI001F059A5A|nr:type II toxin-antitoxin system PemK/MazF family toxin [Clostridium perfringens]MDU8975597.1 type II toxin-antitoxin system PemK/MazF family toxin [Clostridium perfringens]
MDIIDMILIEEFKKQKQIKTDIVNEHEDLINEVDKILCETKENILSGTVEKAINWSYFKNKWLLNENNNLAEKFYNYQRGDIVPSVDLGTLNIGTEIRYPHPCVVLYDGKEDWIIVAPITSAKIDENTKKLVIHEFEVYIEEQRRKPKNPKEFHFKKKSVIQIDQIQRVSKHRILNKKRYKLRVDLLNQVDNIILKKYIPKKFELLEKMKNLNSELNDKLEFEKNKNLLLSKEIEEKNNRIKYLEEKL